jgi:hypothetical protein
MSNLGRRLKKAREEINLVENTLGRALHAVDKALEELTVEEPVAVTVVEPVAVVEPTPVPVPVPPAPEPDLFNLGQTFPSAATVNVASREVRIGTTVVTLPVTLTAPSANTVIAFIRCANGSGGRVLRDYSQPVIFNPGETARTVTFETHPMGEGHTVHVSHSNVPDGGIRGTGATVTATAAAGEMLLPVAPAALPRFAPKGDLVYNATGKQVVDGGLWLDRLAHGRTQPGNAETGYYAPKNHYLQGDDLVLPSYRMATPHVEGNPQVTYPFAASMMSGLIDRGSQWPVVRPELTFKNGSIEWEAKMPNRRGSWPALWLLSHRNGSPKWPFEIDLFEGFYYNNDHRAGSSLSANLHGGLEGSIVRKWTRPQFFSRMSHFGLPSTLDTEFHKFACTVDPQWIRVFVDGIQTFCWQNPFDSTHGWYPLMNVAVKAGASDPYDAGSGDMTVRRVRIWRDNA